MQRAFRVLPGLLVVLSVALLTLSGCGSGSEGPAIDHVRPSPTAPGGLVMVSGRGFRAGDIVWINGRPAARVTWVNDRLLTAVAPEDLATGAYPLEVRSAAGERATAVLNVAGRPAQPVAAQPAAGAATPPPTAAPPQRATPNAAPPPAAAPVRRATPPKEEKDKDQEKRDKDKDKDKKDDD